MSFWQSLFGRSRPVRANLDSLFLLPSAAITLQTAAGLQPTGVGSVCFRSAGGAAFAQAQQDVVALLDAHPDAPKVEVSTDRFGFTWLVVQRDPDDVSGLCTDLHAVNTALEAEGFGSGLLCSLVPFAGADGTKVGLVYLYKQGTFYPFAPTGPEKRDNLTEINVRNTLAGELPMEQDLQRWLAVWGAPGL